MGYFGNGLKLNCSACRFLSAAFFIASHSATSVGFGNQVKGILSHPCLNSRGTARINCPSSHISAGTMFPSSAQPSQMVLAILGKFPSAMRLLMGLCRSLFRAAYESIAWIILGEICSNDHANLQSCRCAWISFSIFVIARFAHSSVLFLINPFADLCPLFFS